MSTYFVRYLSFQSEIRLVAPVSKQAALEFLHYLYCGATSSKIAELEAEAQAYVYLDLLELGDLYLVDGLKNIASIVRLCSRKHTTLLITCHN